MKNNFRKIMEENLNEYSKPGYFSYYQNMYGYKRIDVKKKEDEIKEKEEKTEENNKKLEMERLENERKNKALESEVMEYLENFEEIQADYNDYAAKINEDIDEIEIDIKSTSDVDMKKALEKEKKKLESKLKTYEIKCNSKVRSLNSKLSTDAKKELRDRRDDYHDRIDPLDESVEIGDEVSLSILEEELIFGNTLDLLEEINLIEMTDPLSGEKDMKDVAKTNAETKAQAVEVRAQEVSNTNVGKKTPAMQRSQNATVSSAKIGTARARTNMLAEAETQADKIIAAKEKVINTKAMSIEKEKDNERKDMERKEAALDKMRNQLSIAKEKQKQVSSTQTGTALNSDNVNSLTEAIIKQDPNRIDFNNFSETLFNGASGNALKYFLKGEINNKNAVDIQIAKYMEEKEEVKNVLKKMRSYLRKTASGLSYEEYIDLKVLKGKFRMLFTQAKKEYENRFKK